MSKYTTEVKTICESLCGLPSVIGADKIDQIIELARVKIFDFNYPTFTPEHKIVLETKILKHYYFREIGVETFGQWKYKLNMKLNEIMPFYVKLYQSETLDFNPLTNTSITRVGKNTGITNENMNETTQSNTSGSNVDRNKFSDTPQGSLENVEDGQYLTNYTVDESNNASANTTSITSGKTGNSEIDNTETVTGKDSAQSYSSLLIEFRDTFLNIDMKVIEELELLFMQLW